MTEVVKKRTLILLRQPPYGNGLARAAVELALAMGAFEQDFDLLFTGAGVLQLLKSQDSGDIGRKNLGKTLSSLPLYDLDSVYVDAAALARYGLSADELVLTATPLGREQLQQLLRGADHLLSC